MSTEPKQVERELKKVDDNNFLLCINDKTNKHYQEKGYNRTELRDIHSSVKLQHDQLKHAVRQSAVKLEQLKVEITPEEEKLLKALEKVEKKREFDKLNAQYIQQQADLERIAKELKEITLAVPEVTRKGK